MALPVEVLGSWHPTATKVIVKLARQLARHLGKDDSEVLKHTFERLSVLLMRDNAALLLSRSPDFSPPFIDGDPES